MNRLLFVLPSFSMGGLQKSGLVTINALIKAGYSVRGVLLYNTKDFFNISQELIIYRPSKQSSNPIIKWIQVLFHLYTTIRNSKQDYIIVYGKYYGALISLVVLFRPKVKIVISERNAPNFKMPYAYELFCSVMYFLKKPHLVLSQTKYASQFHVIAYPKSHVKVFNNLFDTLDLTIPFEGDRQKRILVVGRFNDPLKGIEQVVEAFKGVIDIEWQLVIAGGNRGDDKKIDLTVKQLEESGKNCEFLGKVTNLTPIYLTTSIFVLPSLSEGFPNSLVEAMQHGLCCVVTKFNDGLLEIIEHGKDGIIIDNGDVNGISQSLNELINDNERRSVISKNAIKSTKKFEINNRIVELKKLFDVS